MKMKKYIYFKFIKKNIFLEKFKIHVKIETKILDMCNTIISWILKVLDACLIILVVVTYHSAFPLPTLDVIKSLESQF